MRTPTTVLITGASGGIGAALARAYAAPGRTLVLHGRSAERLSAVHEECKRRGAEVESKLLDLRDRDAVSLWLNEVAARRVVDLAIANAGVSSHVRSSEAGESWADIERVLEVNVRAAIATAAALVPHMRRRGAGQIALISSLAAWYGIPLTPAYSASKAALKAYGESLRGWLAPCGVEVNVVLAGFVRTAMSEGYPGPRPWMLSADDAAQRILRGLERNRARISFPFPLDFGMWCLAVMPAPLAQRILRGLGYGG